MKKSLAIVALVTGMAGAGFTSSQAFAQSTTPTPEVETSTDSVSTPTPVTPTLQSGTGRGLGNKGYGTGFIRSYMITYLAGQLDLTEDAITTRLAAGETLFQIAQSTGLGDDEIITLLADAHAYALDQAVSDGLITQTQADNSSTGLGIQIGLKGTGNSILHTYQVTYVAEQLGLTVDAVNTRLAAGETLASIAQSAGLTTDEITTLITGAHTYALQQAVADGLITQAQADAMDQSSDGSGKGNGSGHSGGHGH